MTDKTLNNLAAKNPDKIKSWYKDQDGIWINLKPGWNWQGCTCVHEWNVRDALRSFKDVERGYPEIIDLGPND